jgi:hypothetical protein
MTQGVNNLKIASAQQEKTMKTYMNIKFKLLNKPPRASLTQ